MLATNAAWRAEVVPSPPPETPDEAKARRAKRLTRHPRMRLAGERPSWSDPLQRVFRVDGFACPGCGGAFALRCVVVNPPATRRILDGLRPPGRRAPTGRAEGVTTGRVRSGDVGMRGSFFLSVAVWPIPTRYAAGSGNAGFESTADSGSCSYGALDAAYTTLDIDSDGFLDLVETAHCDLDDVGHSEWWLYPGACNL